MKEIHLVIKPIKLTLLVSLILLAVSPTNRGAVEALASDKQAGKDVKESVFNAPAPPPDIERSDGRTDGGDRGCVDVADANNRADRKPLTALVPLYDRPNAKVVWGLTAAERPTFWFYVPYNAPFPGKFVLYNRENKTVYETDFTLNGKPGVVSLSLPADAAPLEINQRYQWYFKIYCQPEQPPAFTSGRIERRDVPNPDFKTQLEKATPRDRVALLAVNGYWYDALTAAAELRRTEPNSSEWAALLRNIGLPDIASEAISDCCQPKN